MHSPRDECSARVTLRAFLAEVESGTKRVPYNKRETLLIELETHINALAEELGSSSLDRDQAVDAAIAKMGSPGHPLPGHTPARGT